MRSPIRTVLFTVALPLAWSACQEADQQADVVPQVASALLAEGAASASNVVEISGTNYSFQAPIEIASGWTTFRFTNEGPEPHHVTLMRLEEGRTVADLMEALQQGKPLVGIATAVGGPNSPMPGGQSNASVNLEPGEYAMVCVIPSPDGVPHFIKGMVKPITVREGASAATEPTPDVEMTFTDYAFSVSGEIAAGRRTIRATNSTSASEPHEVVLARLAPGATAEDLNHWLHDMKGPPPAEFLGGVTALDPGESNTFTADLTPGEYALICPIPSIKDGEPHSMKGMIHQFTVR